MKQGKDVSLLADNMILNFENGILVEWQYTSASGDLPPQPIDVTHWEGDVDFHSGLTMYNYYSSPEEIAGTGKPIGLTVYTNDSVTISAVGYYQSSTSSIGYINSYVTDQCYMKDKPGHTDASWSDPTSLHPGTAIYVSGYDGTYFCLINTDPISLPAYDPSHSYSYTLNIVEIYGKEDNLVDSANMFLDFVRLYYEQWDPLIYKSSGTMHIIVDITRAV